MGPALGAPRGPSALRALCFLDFLPPASEATAAAEQPGEAPSGAPRPDSYRVVALAQGYLAGKKQTPVPTALLAPGPQELLPLPLPHT